MRQRLGSAVILGVAWWLLSATTASAVQTPPDAAPAAAPATAPASQRPTYQVARTDDSISVDGDLSESVWQQAPTFTLDYETYPAENKTPPVQTQFWITFDERNLYVAVRALDSDPGSIRARLRDRDAAFQDDFVGVVLDTFGDQRRAFEFFVNPLGVQMDLTQNDVTGNEDSSWDALWASAGKLTAEGYQVEMAIPFSSLRFERSSGVQTWGIDALRIWPRDERRRFGLTPQPRNSNCYLCNEALIAGFVGISPGRNIELDPTVTGNDTRSRPNTSAPWEDEQDLEPGLTARWGVTPGTTLNAAINPDFSQVEADAAQLEVNTQFALFFPEKRPFFLEGADLFDTKIGAIYTRNIADPDWGFKVAGKEGKHGYGAILARDAVTNILIPGSQGSALTSLDEESSVGILRYRNDLSAGATLGSIYTDRSAEGYHNRVAGIDGLVRFAGSEAVRLEVLVSDTEYPLGLAQDFGQPDGSFRGHAVRFAYQHLTRNWQGYFNYNEVSEDFRADLGFIPQAGFRKGYGFYEKYLYSDHDEHWWNKLTFGVESTYTLETDGDPLQKQIAPYMYVEGPKQSFFMLYLGTGPSYYQGEEFDRDFVVFSGEAQLSSSTYVRLDGRVGGEIDYDNARQGDIVRITPRIRFEPGRHLRLELSDNHESLDVKGGQLYRADLTELRATYQFNVRSFFRVITQYLDLESNPDLYTFPVAPETKRLFNQLLFSYKLNPQTVLFLGYSDRYLGGDQRIDTLTQSDRTFFLKVGYAFVL